LVPALTEIVPFGRIPRLASEVPVVTGTEPMAVAGEPDELAEAVEEAEFEEDEELVAPLDDVVPDGFNAASTAAVSAELTRFKAVWLAMLASPLD
jgi:hypothetical protein